MTALLESFAVRGIKKVTVTWGCVINRVLNVL